MIIPPKYKDKKIVRTIIYWLLIGLFIRIIFMPYGGHYDLIEVYWKVHGEVYHGEKIHSMQILMYPAHSLYLWLIKPLIPDTFWMDDYIDSNPPLNHMADDQTWIYFFSQPNIHRNLFLFKIPYLIFDIMCGFLFLRFFSNVSKGLMMFKLWMINPVGIFVTYIFGKFEVGGIFFVLLSLYFLKQRRNYLAVFFYSISVLIRPLALLFLPFYIFLLKDSITRRVFHILMVLSVFTLTIHMLGFESLLALSIKYASLTTSKYLFSTSLPTPYGTTIYLFVTGYVLVFLHAVGNKNVSFDTFWQYLLIILLLFFALCYFHPQYFIWVTPFIGFLIIKDKRFVALHAFQILSMVLITFHWYHLSVGYLFASINPSYFINLKTPGEIISGYYPVEEVVNISLSVLTAICIWMIYLILNRIKWNSK